MMLSNRTLTSLDLSHNVLTDRGDDESGFVQMVEALCQNGSLTEISLRGNIIGDQGALAIAKALEENRVLQSVDLRENPIGQSQSRDGCM